MEPVRETVAMATACEQAGFDAFWIAEAYPWWRKHGFEARSSTAVLAVIAAATSRIQLGWGIISPYTRHPVQIGMEARVMQDLAGDRFMLGLGASKIFMKEIGEGEGEKVGPATVMRESIEIVKGVLEGGTFQYEGKVFQASVPPLKSDAHTPRGIPPIYVAGTGPVLQKMAGSIGDGLLTALKIACLVALQGPLDELIHGLKVFPQTIVNVPVKAKPPLESLPLVSAAIEKATKTLGAAGRVVVRYSGTEPKARVMVDAEHAHVRAAGGDVRRARNDE
jgi:hypothetical protein